MSLEIIAEVANAHQGKTTLAKKIIKEFYKHGARSIKFQIYFAEDFLTKDHERFIHFKKQSFSENQWKELFGLAKKIGYSNIYADVLGLKAFRVAKKLKVDGYKVHSTDLMNDALLENISKEKKKVFFSVGGAKISELHNAMKFFNGKSNKLILMHGFQSYPTQIKDTNLHNLQKLKNYFGSQCEYGFQDHISGSSKYNLYLSLVSLGYEIRYLEKHITLDRKKKGVDYYSSLQPKEFKNFCKIINQSAEGIFLSTGGFSMAEDKYRKTTKKFWILKRNLKKNSKIHSKDLEFKRINNQSMEPLFLREIVGKKIKQNLQKNSIICNNHFYHKVCATIVARHDSSRLPGKAALKIEGRPLLDFLFSRAKKSKLVDKIIFCTTKNKSDDLLVDIAKQNKIPVFRGEEKNVLGRILKATQKTNPDLIIRITGDDILIDVEYMDKAIKYHLENNLDYTDLKKIPSGTEVEVFNRKILNFINTNAIDSSGTEYLTYYIKDNEDFFRTGSAPVLKKHQKKIRLTIDNKKDFKFVKPFLEDMIKKRKIDDFNIDDILSFYKSRTNKQIAKQKNFSINTGLKKNSYKKLLT